MLVGQPGEAPDDGDNAADEQHLAGPVRDIVGDAVAYLQAQAPVPRGVEQYVVWFVASASTPSAIMPAPPTRVRRG